MNTFDDELAELHRRRAKIHASFYAKVAAAKEECDAQLAAVDSELALWADADQSIPCLVRRTPGPDHTVYHSYDAPCGRVRDRSNFEVVQEVLAAQTGDYHYELRRCSACGWQEAAAIHARRIADSVAGDGTPQPHTETTGE
ncbi:hypothetical protein [Kitasatospora sp. NBC_01302]|uniref:hypothetical protein n=1 Tax=Kitasatospora sp. NBC_01302 TaxID=2903575 RepID=UPI002E1635E6|nr:hypothetical protein OG294_39870 [Kitasatospora sp. NBC_01302]